MRKVNNLYQERKQDYNFLPEHVAFRIDFFDSFFQPVNLSFHSRTSCLFEFELWLEFFDLQFETVLVSVDNVLALQGLDAWGELDDLLLQLVALLLDVGDSIGLLVNCDLKCFNWLIKRRKKTWKKVNLGQGLVKYCPRRRFFNIIYLCFT